MVSFYSFYRQTNHSVSGEQNSPRVLDFWWMKLLDLNDFGV